jgi:Fur family ferric uptake transcriptional regulator
MGTVLAGAGEEASPFATFRGTRIKMDHSEDALVLRQQGHRLTPQRLVVLDVIKQSRRHLTADEIRAAVLPHYPYINIATIYRTLQWLQEVGLVAPIAIGNGPLRYEYIWGTTHHHLICQECGHEDEIGDDILDALKAKLLERYGFAAHLHHLALPGRCAACRTAMDEREGEGAEGGGRIRE